MLLCGVDQAVEPFGRPKRYQAEVCAENGVVPVRVLGADQARLRDQQIADPALSIGPNLRVAR